MDLKSARMNISETDPFAEDRLNRKQCAETLTNLISSIPGEFVISINGGWGTGKTTFLRMWEQHLKNLKFQTVFFNAWEDDYCDDALVAIIGQIWDLLRGSALEEAAKKVKERAIPVIYKTALKSLKVWSAGTVDLTPEDLQSVSDRIIDDYLDAGQKLRSLKTNLQELAAEVKENTDKPLVFIIDELDRCRPTFAVELLERVKHVFETSNIIFVLGIDREQLGHSVKSLYGQDMDVDGYLRRFIDLEFILPAGKRKLFIENLLSKYGFYNFPNNHNDTIEKLKTAVPVFAELYCLSLREIEHYMRVLLVAINALIASSQAIEPVLLSFMCVLKIKDNESYSVISKGRFKGFRNLTAIIDKQDPDRGFQYTPLGLFLLAYFLVVANDCDKWVKRFEAASSTTVLDDYVKFFNHTQAKRVYEVAIMFRHDSRYQYDKTLIRHLSEKIELATLMVEK